MKITQDLKEFILENKNKKIKQILENISNKYNQKLWYSSVYKILKSESNSNSQSNWVVENNEIISEKSETKNSGGESPSINKEENKSNTKSDDEDKSYVHSKNIESETESESKEESKKNNNESLIQLLNNDEQKEDEQKEEISQLKNIISNNNNNFFSNVKNNSFVSEKPISVYWEKPKKIQKNKLNKDINMSYLNNIECNDVNELKNKRSNTIIIRQFIECFYPEKLKSVVGPNKQKFIDKLVGFSNEKLLIILEQIRCELGISRNSKIFNNIIETGAITIENMLFLFGVDVKGVFEDLKKNDPEFLMELQILACEYDFSSYLNTKTIIFIKLIKSYYMKFNENKLKSKMNIKVDENKLKELNEKFKNLNKI